MKAYPHTITSESITVIVNGDPIVVQKGAANFEALRLAVQGKQWDEILGLLTVSKTVEGWAVGNFKVTDGQVFYKNEGLPTELNARIVKMVTAGNDPASLLKFWVQLQLNPSYRSVRQLYPFMAHEGIALDEDGNILAYKAINQNWTDVFSGKISNKPGAVVEMPRNKISDDPKEACHEGLHVGALNYAKDFGGSERRIIICRIDPKDVVCIPYDASCMKMRVCKYEVIGLFGSQMSDTVVTAADIPPKNDPTLAVPPAVVKPTTEAPAKPAAKVSKPSKIKEPSAKPLKIKAGKAVTPTLKESWDSFDLMDEIDLGKQDTDALRGYASGRLKIVAASKIPGGKRPLIARILDVRRPD